MYESGAILADRYRLESQIGEGGMGAVWRAQHLTLEAPVALKFIDCSGPKGKGLEDRFLREARMCAAIRHRNVVQIMDFGRTDAGPYMVMELLEGRPLGDELKKGQTMPLPRVFEILGQTLGGLAAVHDVGVVHRDLKPDNIFLVRDSDVYYPKLLDFGVSRGMDSNAPESALTTTEGLLAGTPAYMAPEQARGLPDVDARADVYSMGCIMYRALTGQNAFRSKNVGDLIVKKLTHDPPRLSDTLPELTEISDFLYKAMARERDERFRDAREMLAAMRSLALTMPELADTTIAQRGTLASLSQPPSRPPAPMAVGGPVVISSGPPGGGFDSSDPPDMHSLAPATIVERRQEVSSPSGATSGETPLSWPEDSDGPVDQKKSPARMIAAAVAVAAVGLLAMVMSGGDSESASAAAEQAAAEPVAPAVVEVEAEVPAPPEEPEPAEPEVVVPQFVSVHLSRLPRGAKVTLDGAPVEGADLEIERDGESHAIAIEKAGYEPLTIEHLADAHGRYSALLKPIKVQRAPRRPSREIVEDLDF